jgi:hypothetical protein
MSILLAVLLIPAAVAPDQAVAQPSAGATPQICKRAETLTDFQIKWRAKNVCATPEEWAQLRLWLIKRQQGGFPLPTAQ